MLGAVNTLCAEGIDHVGRLKIEHAGADVQAACTDIVGHGIGAVIGDFGVAAVEVNGNGIAGKIAVVDAETVRSGGKKIVTQGLRVVLQYLSEILVHVVHFFKLLPFRKALYSIRRKKERQTEDIVTQVMDDESRAFLADIEQRRGGQITYKAFSTFYADNKGKVCRYGVFFYQVDGVFWFQDFEYVPNFLGFRLSRRKDEEYVMFESSFSPSDVVSIRRVKKKAAINCALGFKDFSKLRKYNPLTGFMSETATEFGLRDGRLLYFQFMDKTVENMIRNEKKELRT